jgi:prevent-host-death family protein
VAQTAKQAITQTAGQWKLTGIDHQSGQCECCTRAITQRVFHLFSTATTEGSDPMTAALIPISDAKARLAELVRASTDEDVMLIRHGRPVAVLMSADRHEGLLELIEDLRDRLSIHEREGLTVDWGKARAELGL